MLEAILPPLILLLASSLNAVARLHARTSGRTLERVWNGAAIQEHNATSMTQAKRHFYGNTLPILLRNNPRWFWKTIKPEETDGSSLIDPNGCPTAKEYVAKVLNNTFRAVFTHETTHYLPSFRSFARSLKHCITFSQSGIAHNLDKLKKFVSGWNRRCQYQAAQKHRTRNQSYN